MIGLCSNAVFAIVKFQIADLRILDYQNTTSHQSLDGPMRPLQAPAGWADAEIHVGESPHVLHWLNSALLGGVIVIETCGYQPRVAPSGNSASTWFCQADAFFVL